MATGVPHDRAQLREGGASRESCARHLDICCRRARVPQLRSGVRPSSTGANQPGLLAYEALTGGVFLIRADGTDNREIVPDGHNPAWSLDGGRLMYERSYGMGGLWRSRPDGADPRLIVGRGGSCNSEFGASDGAWAPSGRRVAFVTLSE